MNSVIIVEGTHDEIRIKSIYPSANVVCTNGSEISEETLAFIQRLSVDNEIIIFTDPDYPGERIRGIIERVVPNAKHAFLRKEDAISRNHKKVGIEHASREKLVEALENVYAPISNQITITSSELYELKLSGYPYSAKLRELIARQLNIGKPNGKTFLKRLNLIQISKEELKELCQKLEMLAL